MKVKIGDTTYDSDEEPIMVVLTAMDRLRIMSMPPDTNTYLTFPKGADIEMIKAWMTEVSDPPVANQVQGVGAGKILLPHRG